MLKGVLKVPIAANGKDVCLQNRFVVVLGFNATPTAKVISWRSVTHMCFLAFSHQY